MFGGSLFSRATRSGRLTRPSFAGPRPLSPSRGGAPRPPRSFPTPPSPSPHTSGGASGLFGGIGCPHARYHSQRGALFVCSRVAPSVSLPFPAPLPLAFARFAGALSPQLGRCPRYAPPSGGWNMNGRKPYGDGWRVGVFHFFSGGSPVAPRAPCGCFS